MTTAIAGQPLCGHSRREKGGVGCVELGWREHNYPCCHPMLPTKLPPRQLKKGWCDLTSHIYMYTLKNCTAAQPQALSQDWAMTMCQAVLDRTLMSCIFAYKKISVVSVQTHIQAKIIGFGTRCMSTHAFLFVFAYLFIYWHVTEYGWNAVNLSCQSRARSSYSHDSY